MILTNFFHEADYRCKLPDGKDDDGLMDFWINGLMGFEI
jgi:hypothetical protein